MARVSKKVSAAQREAENAQHRIWNTAIYARLLGVRFISVNDGYDSEMQIRNDVCGLEVAIKNIINSKICRLLQTLIHFWTCTASIGNWKKSLARWSCN